MPSSLQTNCLTELLNGTCDVRALPSLQALLAESQADPFLEDLLQEFALAILEGQKSGDLQDVEPKKKIPKKTRRLIRAEKKFRRTHRQVSEYVLHNLEQP